MDYFFAVFGYQNRPLEAPWAHQGVQTEKYPLNWLKITQDIEKMIQNEFKKYFKNVEKMSSKN